MGDFERRVAKESHERIKTVMVTLEIFCELGAMSHILVSALLDSMSTPAIRQPEFAAGARSLISIRFDLDAL